jgi:hypothetical protein
MVFKLKSVIDNEAVCILTPGRQNDILYWIIFYFSEINFTGGNNNANIYS